MRKVISLILIISLCCSSLFACKPAGLSQENDTSNSQGPGLTKGLTPSKANLGFKINTKDGNVGAIDFSLRLFQESMSEDKNTIMSPLSVLFALAMVANGADGNTLSQIEEVFGVSVAELNEYLYVYLKSLSSDGRAELRIANSVWIKDDGSISVSEDFMQKTVDHYNASTYQAPFDKSTLETINSWVNDKTDGMIKDILDDISSDAVMYLINAIAFDAEWEKTYQESGIKPGVFTASSGEKRNVQMMHSEEGVYLEDGSATGFMKYYDGRKYAFVALLPNEGMSADKYISTLNGRKLVDLLNRAQITTVNTAMPKFESEYSIELKDVLSDVGMSDAFNPDEANFSKLGSSPLGNLYISRVLHKAFISVDEKGTKAGAATLIEVGPTSAPFTPSKTVILDRPFVYMIIDCETNVPIFIGTVLDI